MKQLRQRAIRDLVDQRPIRTQQELAAALRERGFRTTQATISRDVAELGLIKASREGTQAYALPPRLVEAETSGEDRLRKLLRDLPVEIREAGLLLVIRTLPGSAHAIAAALDRARWPEVAGSIAGDDTVFVAFPDRGSLQRIKRRARCGWPSELDVGGSSVAAERDRRGRRARSGAFDTAERARDYALSAGRTSGARQPRGAWSSFLYLEPVRPIARADRPRHRGPTDVNNKPTYLSKDGLEKLRAELEEMVSVKRPEVAQRIHDAKEHGDLSENAEYEDAKNEQAFVEGRIQTLQALIKNATIIDENHSTDHVQIGSTVGGRERRRQGDVHDRRLGRGQADRGPDLATRARSGAPSSARRRARRSSSGCRPATSPTRSSSIS